MPRTRQVQTNRNPNWIKFERFMRDLFVKVNFDDTIKREDSWHRLPNGSNQIDVFGGCDGIAIVLDCTITDDPDGSRSLKDKIEKTYLKRTNIETSIHSAWPNKYQKILFCIATHNINVAEGDRTLAAQYDIKLVDSGFFESAKKFAKEQPDCIRYGILKKLGIKQIRFTANDASFSSMLEQRPALKICSGDFVGYAFTLPTSLLLRLAYVNRLDTDIADGYQRKINEKKIAQINDFLKVSGNFFVNSILVALDSEPEIVTEKEGLVEIKLPSEYASLEIIDGQHRLFGYVPIKKQEAADAEILRDRQRKDLLPVIAVVDINHQLRHRLFLDINANQKQVDPIQIWTQYGKEHPEVERGYISNILKKLDELGPLADCIYKVGDAKQKKKIITISFLGGVLEKTRLLDKENPDSLVYAAFRSRQYPKTIQVNDQAVKILNEYFAAIKTAATVNWPSAQYTTSLIKSSYGLSIFIELLPSIIKEFEYRHLPLKKEEFANLFIKLSEFLEEKDSSGKFLWEKATLTSAGIRRKALKHFVEKYLLTVEKWRDSKKFKEIVEPASSTTTTITSTTPLQSLSDPDSHLPD